MKMLDTKKVNNRIEYIDAMRGFTMFLVVIHHVAFFNMGYSKIEAFSYHSLFSEFRMPLFFFVSGFVLYKDNFCWNFKNSIRFLKKKFPVQIIGPFIFMYLFSVYRDSNFISDLFDSRKSGYWFTFTLFEFFCFYIITQWIIDLFKRNILVENIVLILSGLLLYASTVYTMLDKWPVSEEFRNLLGIPVWGFYIYFILGNRIRKYFNYFEYMLDNTFLVSASIVIFTAFNFFDSFFVGISNSLYFFLCALSGIIIVFAFFRNHEDRFRSNKKQGYIMQYVGKRTLDIYLIHYFFVYSNMSVCFPNFAEKQSPFLEFLLSCVISIFVITFCLIVSEIIRLSPFVAHYFFGKKL